MASLVVSVGICQDLKPITLVPSPNVAALGLYDKIPVNHFSGMPNISIPIHDIVYRDIKVPMIVGAHLQRVHRVCWSSEAKNKEGNSAFDFLENTVLINR